MVRLVIAIGLLFSSVPSVAAIDLGAASSFAVLGGSAVTTSGATAITGDVGVAPGTALTGFAAATISGGALHAGDAAAVAAHADLGVAYAAVAATSGAVMLTGQDLGGQVLAPGVYGFAAAAQLTGTLHLDALGDPNATWLFQIGSTLITASDAAVFVDGVGNAGNVFFQVGSSATLGTGTHFAGTILALTSITLDSGASVTGRVLASNGAVTLVDNQITLPVPPVTVAPVPEPEAWSLMVAGFGAVGAASRRARLPLRFA